MSIYKLLPQSQAYGYEVGILLLNLVETHIPGDTAHARTYDYPVLFKVVEAAKIERVSIGDPSIESDLVAAAQEMERMGAKAISSNCGFMLHYQDAVRRAVNIPVFLSSLLQLPLAAKSIHPDQTIAILTAWKERLTPQVLKLAGLPEGCKVAINSIETSVEFQGMGENNLDRKAFLKQLEMAGDKLFSENDDIGALLLECAVFTPYAADLQRRFNVPTYDFISLVDFARYVTCRKDYQ